MTNKITIDRATVQQARDWIAERPEARSISAGKMVSILDRALAAPQPAQEPPDLKRLIDRLEIQWHRMGELWERCQGKGWPEKEDAEFRSLRDEKTPATRAAIAALAAPQRQPLTDQEIDDLYINGTKHWIGKREVASAVEALITSKGPAA